MEPRFNRMALYMRTNQTREGGFSPLLTQHEQKLGIVTPTSLSEVSLWEPMGIEAACPNQAFGDRLPGEAAARPHSPHFFLTASFAISCSFIWNPSKHATNMEARG